MKVVVLGATGATGMELIKHSLAAGHSVTAYVRNPAPLQEFTQDLEIRTGDLLDSEQLADVMQGHDAVLSVFGTRVPIAKSDDHLLRNFANALTIAMRQARVRRLVVISTAFLFKDCVIPPTYLIGRLFFPSVLRDSAALEEIIEQSDLDWTIVRPPQLTDSPPTGLYRECLGHLPRFGFKISRADVADYFLKVLQKQMLIRTIVGVSN